MGVLAGVTREMARLRGALRADQVAAGVRAVVDSVGSTPGLVRAWGKRPVARANIQAASVITAALSSSSQQTRSEGMALALVP